MKYFSLVQHSLSIIVMAFFGILIGLAMVPSYFLFYEITELTNDDGMILEAFGICVSLGLGYILWGINILLICGFWGNTCCKLRTNMAFMLAFSWEDEIRK